MKTQSAIKWHGGKSYLAPKIIELLPPRDTWNLWREPFFGGGAVTLALHPEGLSEAVNDIHKHLSNFWDVMSNEHAFTIFRRIIEGTPFSAEKFTESKRCVQIPEHQMQYWGPTVAAHFFIACRQSRQGLMKDFATPTRRVRRGMNENVSAWLSAVDGLAEIHERLKRIEIRNMMADAFIAKYDDPQAVFYCDPPYLHETRSTGGGEYKHEMTEDEHSGLLDVLSRIQGRFLLSGYRSDY